MPDRDAGPAGPAGSAEDAEGSKPDAAFAPVGSKAAGASAFSDPLFTPRVPPAEGERDDPASAPHMEADPADMADREADREADGEPSGRTGSGKHEVDAFRLEVARSKSDEFAPAGPAAPDDGSGAIETGPAATVSEADETDSRDAAETAQPDEPVMQAGGADRDAVPPLAETQDTDPGTRLLAVAARLAQGLRPKGEARTAAAPADAGGNADTGGKADDPAHVTACATSERPDAPRGAVGDDPHHGDSRHDNPRHDPHHVHPGHDDPSHRGTGAEDAGSGAARVDAASTERAIAREADRRGEGLASVAPAGADADVSVAGDERTARAMPSAAELVVPGGTGAGTAQPGAVSDGTVPTVDVASASRGGFRARRAKKRLAREAARAGMAGHGSAPGLDHVIAGDVAAGDGSRGGRAGNGGDGGDGGPRARRRAGRAGLAIAGTMIAASVAAAGLILFQPVVDYRARLACATPAPTVSLATLSKYDQNDVTRAVLGENAAPREDVLRPIRRAVLSMAEGAAGGGVERRCARVGLVAWAQNDALTDMRTKDAQLTRSRLVAEMALAAITLDRVDAFSPRERRIVSDWSERVARDTVRFFATGAGSTSRRNNHRYWAALAVGAAGAFADRPELSAWARESASVGLCSIDDRGLLPLELGRGANALRYHLYALRPLAALKRLDRPDDAVPLPCDDALPRLARATRAMLVEPQRMEAIVGVRQAAPASEEAYGPLLRLDRASLNRLAAPPLRGTLAQGSVPRPPVRSLGQAPLDALDGAAGDAGVEPIETGAIETGAIETDVTQVDAADASGTEARRGEPGAGDRPPVWR